MKHRPLGALALIGLALALPLTAVAQDPEVEVTVQPQVIMNLPEPEHTYGMTLYTRLPVDQRMAFTEFLTPLSVDQARLAVRTLNRYTMPDVVVTPFDTVVVGDPAFDIYSATIEPADRDAFRTWWGGLSPEQQTQYVTWTRSLTYVPTTTPATPETEVSSSGERGQSMGMMMTAAAVVSFLPATEMAAFESMVADVPTIEQFGIAYFLSQLPREHVAIAVKALAEVQERGQAGGLSEKQTSGITETEARTLLRAELSGEDQTAFDSMWSAINWDQQYLLMQLARDAYNGGLNDSDLRASG